MTVSSNPSEFSYELRMTCEWQPSADDVLVLSAGLTAHGLPFTNAPGFKTIAIFLRTDDSDVVGGITGSINWNWLHVELLWIHPRLTGQGHGRALLQTLEQTAYEHGCRQSHVETFSFQAVEFYESRGYSEFARLPNYPTDYERVYLSKQLDL